MIVTGGKTVYGAAIGILMLEAQFPRIPGDIGNALTWPFPVQFRVVKHASPDAIVRNDPRAMLQPFLDAAKDLVASGCDGITTGCGFLSLFQDELQQAAGVPVAASSLMQVPLVQATLPKGKRVGIMTISASTLTSEHLIAAGAPSDSPIVGTDQGKEFTRALLGNELQLDVKQARADMIEAANRLVGEHDNIGAIVLECTNMVPYATDVAAATKLPVFSIYDLVCWLHGSLAPRRWGV